MCALESLRGLIVSSLTRDADGMQSYSIPFASVTKHGQIVLDSNFVSNMIMVDVFPDSEMHASCGSIHALTSSFAIRSKPARLQERRHEASWMRFHILTKLMSKKLIPSFISYTTLSSALADCAFVQARTPASGPHRCHLISLYIQMVLFGRHAASRSAARMLSVRLVLPGATGY